MRPSQGGCCKCCIGNNRCATGFQLGEVSDREMENKDRISLTYQAQTLSLLRESVGLVSPVQSTPATSHCTHLSTTFARIGLILLHRRLRIGALVFHLEKHSLSRAEKSTGVHRRSQVFMARETDVCTGDCWSRRGMAVIVTCVFSTWSVVKRLVERNWRSNEMGVCGIGGGDATGG